MSHVSHTAEGFRAAFRRPSLTFAEISWRWAVGATGAGLGGFALFEYINSLPVTDGQLLLLRSRQAYLVGPVLAHILRGSLSRVVLTALFASLALCGLWIVAASIGRAVIVGYLVEYFAERGKDASFQSPEAFSKHHVRALLSLNFLRAALALAAVLALAGAAITASFASSPSDLRPGLTLVMFFTLAGVIWWAYWALNWLLSLASVFAARGVEDAIGAVSAAVTLCRERAGAVFAVSTWTGILHLAVLMGAGSAISIGLGMIAAVPWRLATAGMTLVALAYFALTDWLYVARLAGYVSILELPEVPDSSAPLPSVLAHCAPSGLPTFQEVKALSLPQLGPDWETPQ